MIFISDEFPSIKKLTNKINFYDFFYPTFDKKISKIELISSIFYIRRVSLDKKNQQIKLISDFWKVTARITKFKLHGCGGLCVSIPWMIGCRGLNKLLLEFAV